MRKLKGGVQKETAKQKKQRREDFAKVRRQLTTLVLPSIGVIAILIGLYVYFKTRPYKAYYD